MNLYGYREGGISIERKFIEISVKMSTNNSDFTFRLENEKFYSRTDLSIKSEKG